MVDEFRKRRTKIMELVDELPGMECSEPDGAFYIFPVVRSYFGKTAGEISINNADDLCMYLLHHGHVSTVTGSAFGDPDCIRISFANSLKNIETGFERIRKALAKLG
jgi:aspartate aminotransferase